MRGHAEKTATGVTPTEVERVSTLALLMRNIAGVERIRIEQHSWTGTVWAFGWLFTIGYLHLTFWKAVLALILWPYYLGVTFSVLR